MTTTTNSELPTPGDTIVIPGYTQNGLQDRLSEIYFGRVTDVDTAGDLLWYREYRGSTTELHNAETALVLSKFLAETKPEAF